MDTNWVEYHRESEKLASLAEIAIHQGKYSLAMDYYRKAAELEELAFLCIGSAMKRTLGVVAVSVAALWYKGEVFDRMEGFIDKVLEYPLPGFAVAQLLDIKNKREVHMSITTLMSRWLEVPALDVRVD